MDAGHRDPSGENLVSLFDELRAKFYVPESALSIVEVKVEAEVEVGVDVGVEVGVDVGVGGGGGSFDVVDRARVVEVDVFVLGNRLRAVRAKMAPDTTNPMTPTNIRMKPTVDSRMSGPSYVTAQYRMAPAVNEIALQAIPGRPISRPPCSTIALLPSSNVNVVRDHSIGR